MNDPYKVSLSKTQQRAVKKMEQGKWWSAYGLQESLSTLNALHRKGVIERRAERGSGFMPRICIKFRLIGESWHLGNKFPENKKSNHK